MLAMYNLAAGGGTRCVLAMYGLYRGQRWMVQRQRAQRRQAEMGGQVEFLKKLEQLPAKQRRTLAAQQLMLEQ